MNARRFVFVLVVAVLLQSPSLCQAGSGELVEALNARLAAAGTFTTSAVNGRYANLWRNAYRCALDGTVLEVSYIEDVRFYKEGQLQDRYREEGSYRMDLTATGPGLVTVAGAGERLQIGCAGGAACASKTMAATFYDSGQAVRSRRQGSTAESAVALFLDPAKITADLVTLVQDLVVQVQLGR